MTQPGEHLGLAVEALGEAGGARDVGVHHLEGHAPTDSQLLGLVDGAHAPLAELAHDVEAPADDLALERLHTGTS